MNTKYYSNELVYVRVGQRTYEPCLIVDCTVDGMVYYCHSVDTGKREWHHIDAIRDCLPSFSLLSNPNLLELDLDISDLVDTKSGLREVG